MWNRLQTTRLRLIAAAVVSTLSVLTFTVGVGAASLVDSVMYHATGKAASNQVKSIMISPLGNSVNPATLKVEVVREGKTLCTGASAVPTSSNGYAIEYSMEKPMSDCPVIRTGDVVKATLLQSNEINISYDKR